MNYAEFKRKCIERTNDEGYFDDGYVLCIDKKVVSRLTVYDNDDYKYIFICFISANHSLVHIFEDEIAEYEIEWFVLEKE